MERLKNKERRPFSKASGSARALLAFSVLANVWLAHALLQPSGESASAGTKGTKTADADGLSVPTPLQAPAGFDWRIVESADYHRYFENLHVIGCPAETATNLIAGLILDDYWAWMWEAARPLREDFWRFKRNPQDPGAVLLRDSITRREEGNDGQGPFPARSGGDLFARGFSLGVPESSRLDEMDEKAETGFLPVEKQKALRAVVGEWDGRLAPYMFANGPPVMAGMEEYSPSHWQTNDSSLRPRLLEALTPAEEEEFEIRHSSPAGRIRGFLYGYAAAPGELRGIAKVMLDAEKENSVLGPDIRNYQAVEDRRLKEYLGEERFAEFKRGLEPGFRKFALLQECYNAPAGSAADMHEMEKQTAATARELLADPKATEVEKRTSLDDLREGLRRKMRSLFGPRALETYELNGGFALPALEAK